MADDLRTDLTLAVAGIALVLLDLRIPPRALGFDAAAAVDFLPDVVGLLLVAAALWRLRDGRLAGEGAPVLLALAMVLTVAGAMDAVPLPLAPASLEGAVDLTIAGDSVDALPVDKAAWGFAEMALILFAVAAHAAAWRERAVGARLERAARWVMGVIVALSVGALLLRVVLFAEAGADLVLSAVVGGALVAILVPVGLGVGLYAAWALWGARGLPAGHPPNHEEA